MKLVTWLAIAPALVGLLVIGAGQIGLFSGAAPESLGLSDGKLAPPLTTPNSVSSQAGLYPGHPQAGYAAIDPLAFSGDGAAAMERLAGILEHLRGTTIVTRRPGYLYAQCRTLLLRFTDDVEFALDKPTGVINVRSASRLGSSDLGANRARIETIRAQFMAP